MAKEILLICGTGIDNLDRVKNSLNNRNINLECVGLFEFFRRCEDGDFFKKNYDQIVVFAHGAKGVFEDNVDTKISSAKRSGHALLFDKDKFVATSRIINFCVGHTNKIVVSSCNSGAVMKDLTALDLSSYSSLEILAFGGSKHDMIVDASKYVVEDHFLQNGFAGLFELAAITSPDTISCYSNNEMLKLGSIKIGNDGNGQYCYRKKSRLNKSSLEWEEEETIRFERLEELSSDFKSIALGTAIAKNKREDAMFWRNAGGDINAKLFIGAGISGGYESRAFMCDSVEELSLLMDVGGRDVELSGVIASSAAKGHREVVEFLFDKEVDLKLYSCDREENPVISAAFAGRLDIVGFFFSRLDARQVGAVCESAGNIAKASSLFDPIEMAVVQNLFLGAMKAGSAPAVERLLNNRFIGIEDIKENFQSILKEGDKEKGESLFPTVCSSLESRDLDIAQRKIQEKELKNLAKEFQRRGWDVPEKFSESSRCNIM